MEQQRGRFGLDFVVSLANTFVCLEPVEFRIM